MTRSDKGPAGKPSKSTKASAKVQITNQSSRPGGVGGTWASGTVGDYRFEALVFNQHAEVPEHEVGGDSYISKLWVQRSSDQAVVYNWDRGLDRPAANARVTAVVEQLARELASAVFKPSPAAVKQVEDLFEQIARKHLSIPTLQTRNRDALDFHEVGVSEVRRALAAAYAAGQASKQNK